MNPRDLISKIEDEASKRGLKPTTLSEYAGLGARAIERLSRQADRMVGQRAKLLAYLARSEGPASGAPAVTGAAENAGAAE